LFYKLQQVYKTTKRIMCFRTPSRVSPKIDGKDIDLYLLYVLVTAQGGWVKVSLFDFVGKFYSAMSYENV